MSNLFPTITAEHWRESLARAREEGAREGKAILARIRAAMARDTLTAAGNGGNAGSCVLRGRHAGAGGGDTTPEGMPGAANFGDLSQNDTGDLLTGRDCGVRAAHAEQRTTHEGALGLRSRRDNFGQCGGMADAPYRGHGPVATKPWEPAPAHAVGSSPTIDHHSTSGADVAAA